MILLFPIFDLICLKPLSLREVVKLENGDLLLRTLRSSLIGCFQRPPYST